MFPQVVTLQAIDDNFIDGGDALVFPPSKISSTPFAARSPSRVARWLVKKRFLNDPFRLPEETNERAPDGTLLGMPSQISTAMRS